MAEMEVRCVDEIGDGARDSGLADERCVRGGAGARRRSWFEAYGGVDALDEGEWRRRGGERQLNAELRLQSAGVGWGWGWGLGFGSERFRVGAIAHLHHARNERFEGARQLTNLGVGVRAERL